MTRAARLTATLALLAAAAGCSSGGARPVRSSAPPSGTYTNPVYGQDFPDPAVLRVGGTYHAFATQGGGKNIQTLSSTDLVHWRPGADALPEVGGWAMTGATWAPEVIALAGRYVMFYVAHDTASGRQCIGRAVATDPAGPYTDPSRAPLVCQSAQGGSIDPDPVRGADGTMYLYWKNDGNCCGQPVRLWGQRLSADGARLLGSPVALLGNTKAWQGSLIEAPEMVAHAGRYTLFYSANDYASDRYGIGYAHCAGPLGPCQDESDQPLVASDGAAAGPGHCFVLQVPGGGWWMLFHAWPPTGVGAQYPGRLLWLEPVSWQGNTPSVHPPDAGPQPAPSH